MGTAATNARRTLTPAVAIAMVLLAVAVVPLHGASSSKDQAPMLTPAVAPATIQWAYGGTASGSFSCSGPSCVADLNLSLNNSTISLSWKYYVAWVVIYAQTNVSPTQTEITTETALNVSASYSYSVCTNLTPLGPCATTSASVSLGGVEAVGGSTNLTNGTVNLTAGPGSSGPIPALAITNASAHASLNISGSLAITSANISGNGNFDLGGSAASSVQFGAPLGIVPSSPATGDRWTASAPYTATGTYVTGYSYSVSAAGYPAMSNSSWTHGSVSPAGTLTISGQDLGPTTLWDNYTNPHSALSARHVSVDFPGDQIAGSDGWILAPAGLTGGFASLLGGNSTSWTNNSSEDLYYEPGTGFVGASLAGNASSVSVLPAGPSVSVQAGPEPVSVAEQQYAAITANGAGASGIPLLLVVGLVAMAGVAVAVVVVLRHNGRWGGKPPAPEAALATGAPAPPSTDGPTGPA